MEFSLFDLPPINWIKVVGKLNPTSFARLSRSSKRVQQFIQQYRHLVNISVGKTLVIKIYNSEGQRSQTVGSVRFRGMHTSDADKESCIAMRLYPNDSRNPIPNRGTVNMRIPVMDQLKGFTFHEIDIVQCAARLQQNQLDFLRTIFSANRYTCFRLKFIESFCDVALIPFFKFSVFQFEAQTNTKEIVDALGEFKQVVEINNPNRHITLETLAQFPYIYIHSYFNIAKIREFVSEMEIKTKWIKVILSGCKRGAKVLETIAANHKMPKPVVRQLIDFEEPRLCLEMTLKRKVEGAETGYLVISLTPREYYILLIDFFTRKSTIDSEIAAIVWPHTKRSPLV